MSETEPVRMRRLGVVLFILALVATLLGAFHLIENWRGKRKWENYSRKLIGQGEKLDLPSFVPAAIAEEQNFAAASFFADLLPGPKPTNWHSRHWPEIFGRLTPQTSSAKPNRRQLTDLVAWQRAIRGTNDTDVIDRGKAAQGVLTALKVYEPALEELRAASRRPLSRYGVHYDMNNPWGIRLPHLPVIKELARLLSLKACAELAAGNSDRAFEDVRLMARIVRSMDTELFLINYMVDLAALQLMLQPIWEGLALERWSDRQLEELQAMMLQFNFIAQLTTPMRAERAAGILTVDLLAKQRYKAEFLDALTGQQGSNIAVRNILALLVPRGWYRLEQYEYTRLYQTYIMPGSDGTNRLVDPGVIARNQAQVDKALPAGLRGLQQHRLIARLLIPAIGKIHRRAAEAQSGAHQAAIACALERYRRKHGDYPKELAALVPEFMQTLPHDVIGGKPMHYRPDNPIVLYSVGWDANDDRGTPGKLLWDEQGDWVWTYPESKAL